MADYSRSDFLRLFGTGILSLGATGAVAAGPVSVPLAAAPPTPDAIDVTSLGAIGDGVHDDGPSLQAAINAAGFNDGCVYFRPGKYLVTSPLRISGKKNFRMIGSGTILSTAATAVLVGMRMDASGQSVVSERIDFTNLHFVCASKSGYQEAIQINGGIFVRVESCTFDNFSQAIVVSTAGNNHELFALHNHIQSTREGSIGISLCRPDNLVANNLIRGCSTGIFVAAGGQYLTGNHIYRHPSPFYNYSIVLGGLDSHPSVFAEMVMIIGNYLDNPSKASILVRSDSTSIHIQNNLFYASDGAVLDDTTPQPGVVSGAPFLLFHRNGNAAPVNLRGILASGNMFRAQNGVQVATPVMFRDGLTKASFHQSSIKGNTFFNATPTGFQTADFV